MNGDWYLCEEGDHGAWRVMCDDGEGAYTIIALTPDQFADANKMVAEVNELKQSLRKLEAERGELVKEAKSSNEFLNLLAGEGKYTDIEGNPIETVECPVCGFVNLARDDVCDACGISLKGK